MSTLSSYATDPGYRSSRFRPSPPMVFAAVFLAGALVASLLTWVIVGNDRSGSDQLLSRSDVDTSRGFQDDPPGGAEFDDDADEADDPDDFDNEAPNRSAEAAVVEWSDVPLPPRPLLGGDATMVSILANQPGSLTSSERTIEIWADDGRAFRADGADLVDGLPTEPVVEVANPLAGLIDVLDATTTAPVNAAADSLLIEVGLDPGSLTLRERNDELWRVLSRSLESGTLHGVRWTRTLQLVDSLGATEFALTEGSEADDRNSDRDTGSDRDGAVPGEDRSRSGPFVEVRWFGHSDGADRLIRLSASSGAPVLGGVGSIETPDDWLVREEFDARRIRLDELARRVGAAPPARPPAAPPTPQPQEPLPSTITDLSLDAKGLIIRTPEGQSLLLPFGDSDRDTIVFTMGDLYGIQPDRERYGVDCDGLQTDEVVWGDLTMSFDRLEGRFLGWKVSGPNPGIGATNGAQYGTTVANFPEDVSEQLFRVGSRWVYDDLWATWVFDDAGPNGRLVEFWTGQVCP